MSDDPVWFDTHLHLEPGDDAGALFAAARQAGVGFFLIAGTDAEDSARALAAAASDRGGVAAVGVHPHAARLPLDLEAFRALAAAEKTVAIGEVGLDYYYEHSPRADQRRVFAAFLQLALEVHLPAIVHCRDAFEDCLPMVREAAASGLRVLLHSFAGTPAQAEEALALGAMFSFSGMVTFPRADNIRAALAVVPMDRLFVETDSPYLAPVPYRGRRNQPAYAAIVGRRVADEKRMNAGDAARVTTRNALRFFGMQSLPEDPPGQSGEHCLV